MTWPSKGRTKIPSPNSGLGVPIFLLLRIWRTSEGVPPHISVGVCPKGRELDARDPLYPLLLFCDAFKYTHPLPLSPFSPPTKAPLPPTRPPPPPTPLPSISHNTCRRDPLSFSRSNRSPPDLPPLGAGDPRVQLKPQKIPQTPPQNQPPPFWPFTPACK